MKPQARPQEHPQNPVFDYAQKQRTIQNDQTPMSELSYSYSDFPHGYFGSSQYGGATLNQSRGGLNNSTIGGGAVRSF